MKIKFTTLFIVYIALFATANAQQYNLFDPADIDADGWIWFDTQAKIDKYVGQADNEGYKIDKAGKIIQLIDANYDPYEGSTADPNFIGVGTDKNLEGVGAKRGTLTLSKASAAMATNGGGLVVRMPSCMSFNIFLSSESSMLVRLHGATNEDKTFGDYIVVSAKYTTVFSPLSSAGQFSWNQMEKLNNGKEPFFNLTSSTPIFARLENMKQYPLYIHGMKVITSTPMGIDTQKVLSSISFDGKTLTLVSPEYINIYTITGCLVASQYADSMDLSNLPKGLYVVKAAQETIKVSIR